MSDNPQVQKLLDELLEGDSTPEEVCSTIPELLPVVKDRWRQICQARAEFDALLPQWPKGTPPPFTSLEAGPPHIPGYDIESVLGQGGMGIVFRARHRSLGRLVALKMALAGGYASPQERERFRREAESVAALRHPNIVQVFDVGDWSGRPFFTMELVDGGSLAQRLAGMPQPALEAAKMLAVAAEAIHAAHKAGIVHRDLKPANIMFSLDGVMKITDFGLARRLDETVALTISGAMLGTPSYMAPEQVRGNSKVVGPAADVYALGSILYELLTGRPPFRCATPTETLLQVIEQEPVSPGRLNSKVPRDLETICLKCLEKEPKNRYATAKLLVDDLKRFSDLRPIRARPLGLPARMWRWSRRNPAAAGMIATTALLFGLASGGGLWLEHERAERRAGNERQSQAVEVALEEASALGKAGRWLQAQAVLVGTPSQLGNSESADLQKRLVQARADAQMALRLDEVRSRLSTNSLEAHSVAASMYAQAFQNYGIDLSRLNTNEASALISSSAIRDALVAYLHDWHYWALPAEQIKLQHVLDQVDGDPWRRAFREAVALRHDNGEKASTKLAALAAAPDVLTQPPLVISGLAGVALFDGRRDVALALLQRAQQHHPDDFWYNYLLGLYWEGEHPETALGFIRAAIAVRPDSCETCTRLGRALLQTEDREGAITAFRRALELNPTTATAKDLARSLAPYGRLEEARSAWEEVLKHDPPDHESWYGYAQLCLFLKEDEAYKTARRGLLERFGDVTDDWIVAERVSLACLLQPGTDEELSRAVALAKRALNSNKNDTSNPYLNFLSGLIEYRRGEYERAIPLLETSADSLPNRAGPRLVLAMAEFKSGAGSDARGTLATAVGAYNWQAAHADHPTSWVNHAFRREAESMILNDALALLRGDVKPIDNKERLCLFAVFESEARYAAASEIAAAVFAAEPKLADELSLSCLRRATLESENANCVEVLNSEFRYRAARCAALAAGGFGEDATGLTRNEQKVWRMKAVEWLRTDLEVLSSTVKTDSRTDCELVNEMLVQWQKQADLAAIRERDRMRTLPEDQRRACTELWKAVRDVQASCDVTK